MIKIKIKIGGEKIKMKSFIGMKVKQFTDGVDELLKSERHCNIFDKKRSEVGAPYNPNNIYSYVISENKVTIKNGGENR